jgi:hypothetical protein
MRSSAVWSALSSFGSGGMRLSFRVVRREIHEHANAAHFLALLRARRERPRGCAAKQRDERAPPT